jgi:putative FmdB family regulatory protein
MAIYEYIHVEDSKDCKPVIEIIQKMDEAPLESCPHCGEAIRKKISLPGKHVEGKGNIMSDSNLKEKGFTKYVKSGDGKYQKAAGSDEAPDTLDRSVMNSNLNSMGM